MCSLSYTSVRPSLCTPDVSTDSSRPAGAETVRIFFSDSPSRKRLNGIFIDHNCNPHSNLRLTYVPGGPG